MGLDSSGRPGVVQSLRKSAADAKYLIATRRSVCQILERSKETALSIDRSSDRLRGMGDRLPSLQAAIRPLQSQSRLLKALGAKIDGAIQPAETVLKTFELVHDLEKTLKGDPRGDMPLYLAALAQLEEAIQYLSGNCLAALGCIADAKEYLAKSNHLDKYRTHRLSERLAFVQEDINSSGGQGWDMGLLAIALDKLETAFKNLLQERSQAIVLPSEVPHFDEAGMLSSPLPILLPASVTLELQTLVERLSLHKRIENVLMVYRELRLATIKESLQSLDAVYLCYSDSQRVDELEWADLEGMIGLWTRQIEIACITLFRSERRLCSRVFGKLEKERWIRCWGKLATEGFGPFLSFAEGVVSSQTLPEKLFKLLDMYDVIENLLRHVLEIFEGPDSGCGEVRVRCRELLKKIAGKASETVWELCRFIEVGWGDAPADGGRSRKCNYVVNYVKYLSDDDYGPIISKIIRNERSWQGKELKEELGDKWLSLVVMKVIMSLEKCIVSQSNGYTDSALANIFLLNNLWYVFTRAKDSHLGPLLGDSWMRDTKAKVQKHMRDYQREAWGKSMSYLSRDGLSGSSSGRGALKELARQRLKIFSFTFEENCQKHSEWAVQAEDLKGDIRLAVTQALVPAYRSYIQAYQGLLEQASNNRKYMRFSPEDVETMLGELFEIRADDSGTRIATSSRNSKPSFSGKILIS